MSFPQGLATRDMAHYTEAMTISRHTKPICFVTFSTSGELLATGDDDGYVLIWSLAAAQFFQSLTKCSAEAVSCCWADDKEIFVGSGNGELYFFQHVATHNRFHRSQQFFVDGNRTHIAALAAHSNRLVCSIGNTVHCYRIEGSALQKTFSWSMGGVREIRTVHFIDRQTLLATTIKEGECVLLDVLDPSRPLWRRKLRHRIGESALSADGKYLAVTTLASTVRVYTISPTGLNLLHDFPAPTRVSSNFPLQICFAESQRLVVSGSDSGEIRVWDLASGRMHVLRHAEQQSDGKDGRSLYLVQAVAARSTRDRHLIASACSEPTKVTVKVWAKPLHGDDQPRLSSHLSAFVILVVMLAGLSNLWPPLAGAAKAQLSHAASWAIRPIYDRLSHRVDELNKGARSSPGAISNFDVFAEGGQMQGIEFLRE